MDGDGGWDAAGGASGGRPARAATVESKLGEKVGWMWNAETEAGLAGEGRSEAAEEDDDEVGCMAEPSACRRWMSSPKLTSVVMPVRRCRYAAPLSFHNAFYLHAVKGGPQQSSAGGEEGRLFRLEQACKRLKDSVGSRGSQFGF